MLRTGKSGLGLCVTVTLLDGLVLARSAFHHSMNYRSVVLLGTATVVDDLIEKRAAFRALVEHVVPGRYAGVRAPSDDEITGTLVLRLPITEGSAKVPERSADRRRGRLCLARVGRGHPARAPSGRARARSAPRSRARDPTYAAAYTRE